MSTPSGRAARSASLHGDDYQHLISWRAALRALAPTSGVNRLGLEHPEGGAYDDVVLFAAAGGGEFTQAKFVMDALEGFSLDWLIEPAGAKRVSLAQRALMTYRQLRPTGPVRLTMVTNREVAAGATWLGQYRAASQLTFGHAVRRLYAGEHQAAEAFAAFEQLREHLACDEQEFLALLDLWVFRWAHSVPDAEELSASRMMATGLCADDEALGKGVGLIRDLVKSGVREISTDDLRLRVEALGLEAEPPYRILSVSALLPEEHAPVADVTIDLQDLFDGREDDAARGLAADRWVQVEQRLKEGVTSLGHADTSLVLVHAAVRLPTWFRLGTLMRSVAGWQLACALGGVQYRSSDAPAPGAVLTSELTPGTTGDLVVTLSVSNDIRQSVTTFLKRGGPAGVGRLDLVHPAPGPRAVSGKAEAARIVDELRTAVMSALESGGVQRVHLFMSAPRMLALFAGHRWHRLKSVTVYEDLGVGEGYQPAFTTPG